MELANALFGEIDGRDALNAVATVYFVWAITAKLLGWFWDRSEKCNVHQDKQVEPVIGKVVGQYDGQLEDVVKELDRLGLNVKEIEQTLSKMRGRIAIVENGKAAPTAGKEKDDISRYENIRADVDRLDSRLVKVISQLKDIDNQRKFGEQATVLNKWTLDKLSSQVILANNVPLLRILLESNFKTDVNLPENLEGWLPIHFAAESGYDDMVTLLVEHGATIDALGYVKYADQSSRQSAPLHVAAENGRLSCVSTLVKLGAQVDIRDSKGQTPLHRAAAFGQLKCCVQLIWAGADIDSEDDSGKTCLHLATRGDHTDCVSYVCNRKGAKVNAVDKNGKTALHIACQWGSIQSMKELVRCHADVNSRDGQLNSPLHLATVHNRVECVELLCASGADLSQVNVDSETALVVAKNMGFDSIVDILESK